MNKILRNSIVAAMVLGTVGTSSFYNYTYAKGDNAVQEGTEANASGDLSVAIGYRVDASKEGSVVIGANASANGYASISLGGTSSSEEYGSVALGIGAKAKAEGSIALGALSIATDKYEISVGRERVDEGPANKAIYRRITHVADGTGDHDAVTLSQVKALIKGTTKIDVTNIDLATNNTFKTLKTSVEGKANTNADNITVSDWATKLGTGEVVSGNTNLVTGGKVFAAIKDKADKSELSDYAKATDLTTLKTQVTDITNGTTKIDVTNIDLANNNTFKTLQNTVNGKANTNADNITVSDWATKLGTGEVATGDVNLVTGGKVFDAIKDKADKSTLSDYAKATDLTALKTQVTNITNGTTKIDVTNIDLATNNTFKTLKTSVEGKANASDLNAYAKADGSNVTTPATWATKLGTGEVATGNANLVTGGKVFAAIKDKADKSELSDYAKATALTELETKVTNITNGTTQIDGSNINLATNTTFTTLQGTVNGKANTNADNITVSDWATKLGTGEVATGDVNLVTGGKVFDAIKDKADKSTLSDYAKATDLTALKTQVTNITNGTTKIDVTNIDLATNNTFKTLKTSVEGKANTNADNITVSDWATKLGTGEVVTGNANLVTGGKVFDAIKDKADKSTLSDYAKATDLTALKTQVTNITNGTTKIDVTNIDLATNNTFKTLKTSVEGKANTNADNITVSDWATKLGTGEVATGNTNLVTGGTVFNAIKDKADKSELSDYAKTSALADLEKQVTNITNGTTKIDVTNIDLANNNKFKTLQTSVEGKANADGSNVTTPATWATKLGTGEVATGNANLVTGGKVFDAIKDKADKSTLSDYAKATDLTALKTQVTNITNGTTKIDVTNIDLANNNTFKTLQNTVNGKANANADNITVSDWATKLGTGTVAENNKELVTGGTVYTALSAYAKASALTELEKQVTNITNGTTPVMTFTGTNGITATVSNNKITLGMNWEDASAPKFHIYQDQGESSAVGRRRRARSVGDTSSIPGTRSISSMDLGHLNMVFGEGLKAEKKEKNGTTYTLISLAGNTGMSKFTVKTDEKDKTTQKEKTFDVKSGDSTAQLNVVGDGKNISTSVEKDNTVKVSLKDDVSINSLTAKTVTTDTVKVGTVKGKEKVYLDEKGIHANDQVISDVKAGEKDSDAVNVGQLKDLARHTDKIGGAVGKLAVESRNGDALNAALSALRPLDYDPESKFDVSAGYGTYKGVHAVAVGTFYRPNATTLFSIGGSFTGGDSMMNAGVSFKVGSGSGSQTYLSRQAIASMLKRFSVEHEAMKNVLVEQDARTQAQIEALQKENSSLKDKVNRLEKENQDRIEKANNRIAELERQVKEVLINLKK